MSAELTTQNNNLIIQNLVLTGDLSKLDPNTKVLYYKQFCNRLGLDPLTQPFKLLKLNGKETLYCDRSGAQQLNKLHKVSHQISGREYVNDCYVVTTKAYDYTGRQTESIGAVPTNGLKGEAFCNAIMKAETKSKRRATLDFVGLGILDISEVEAIEGAQISTIPLSSNGPTPAAIFLPAISKEQYTKLKDRLKAGEVDILSKAIVSFSFSAQQMSELEELLPPKNDVSHDNQ